MDDFNNVDTELLSMPVEFIPEPPPRHQAVQVLFKIVRERNLCDRNAHSRTEMLREQHNYQTKRGIFSRQDSLHCRLRSLEADAAREARGEVVRDKPHEAGVDFEGRYETCENRHQDGREEHEGGIVTQRARSGAGKENPDSATDDDGDHHEPAFGGRVLANDLVVGGEVVFEHVNGAICAHGEDEAGDDATAF